MKERKNKLRGKFGVKVPGFSAEAEIGGKARPRRAPQIGRAPALAGEGSASIGSPWVVGGLAVGAALLISRSSGPTPREG